MHMAHPGTGRHDRLVKTGSTSARPDIREQGIRRNRFVLNLDAEKEICLRLETNV